jgi:uncharacterized alkaline shock family protein YloU
VDNTLGKVTIAPNVLITIVQKTAASEAGVAQLCDNVPGVKRWLGLHTAGRGVEVSVADNEVTVDLYVIARRDVDLLQMGRNLQSRIVQAIHDMVGMEVREANIHIDDVATELSPDKGKSKDKGK